MQTKTVENAFSSKQKDALQKLLYFRHHQICILVLHVCSFTNQIHSEYKKIKFLNFLVRPRYIIRELKLLGISLINKIFQIQTRRLILIISCQKIVFLLAMCWLQLEIFQGINEEKVQNNRLRRLVL